ncbi:MAG: histidine phosphatase family protein [Kineosporiaceae bacterium]|nr:histidine phosphatase family protein [Kineosporiaceae bacterium]
MSTRTVVHLLRHGEVENPNKVLYGRLPDYHLSERGRAMAERAREYFVTELAARADDGIDPVIARVVASPMERAQETAAPLAAALGLDIAVDGRLIEAANVFEGKRFGIGDGALREPSAWRHLYNPFRPSWGEPYARVAQRMHAALAAAREAAPGRHSVLVSHQLPIWIARLAAEKRRLWHDPRRRQCNLASVTSFHYDDTQLALISYAEPAADLVAGASTVSGA